MMDWQCDFKISSIKKDVLLQSSSPLEDFRSFANDHFSILLLDPEGTSFVATDPLIILTADNNMTRLSYLNGFLDLDRSPYVVIDKLLENFNQNTSNPVSMFGYLGYESACHFEKKFLSDQPNPYPLPDICMALFANVKIFKKTEKGYQVEQIKLVLDDVNNKPIGPMTNSSPGIAANHSADTETVWNDLAFSGSPKGLQSTMARQEYIEKVNLVKSMICRGEIYQGNLTQLLKCPFQGNGLELMESLYRANPARYFAYFNLGQNQIISTSPESFLHTDEGELCAHPIKGTIGRGANTIDDKTRLDQLLNSHKDAAELSMIVDLFRNDLNRVCQPGTVRVKRHKYIKPLNNVYHLASEVRGEIHNRQSACDFLASTFPSGSITGCPKIRSVEILRELEPTRRSVYSGAIGWISHRDLNLNVAIRTLVKQKDEIYFQVGGGIVYDSVADSEYDESLDKARPFFDTINSFNQRRTEI